MRIENLSNSNKSKQPELFENQNKLLYFVVNKNNQSTYYYKFIFNGLFLEHHDTKPLNKVVTINIKEDVVDDKGKVKKVSTGETESYNTIPLLESSLDGLAREFYKMKIKDIDNPLVLDIEYNPNKSYLEIYNGKINLFNKHDYIKHFNKQAKQGDYPLIKHLLTNMFGECYNAKLNFLKYKYQNPFINTGFAFVLYGANQIGKSTFIETLLSNIFGMTNISPNNKINKGEDFKFNSNWIDKLVTCFEEYKASDSDSIDTLKALIKANYYNKEGKGSNKELIPHYNTYYINTNDYPVFLEKQRDSKRFIVLDLGNFNSESNPLYKKDSKESDFINEIPYFIYDLINGECTRPQYEDFDKINTLNLYTTNNIDIWINVFNDLINKSNIDYIEAESGFFFPITKSNSNIELINDELNKELGNSMLKSVNYNKKQLISKIIDLKNGRFKTSINGSKSKRVKDRVLQDYIFVSKN